MSRAVFIHLLVIGYLPCVRSSVFTDVEACVRTVFCFEPDNKNPLCMRHFSLIHVSVLGLSGFCLWPLWTELLWTQLRKHLFETCFQFFWVRIGTAGSHGPCLIIGGASYCSHSPGITSHPSNSAQGFQLLLVLSTHCSLVFTVYTGECEVARFWVLRILCVFQILLFLYQLSAFIFYSNL